MRFFLNLSLSVIVLGLWTMRAQVANAANAGGTSTVETTSFDAVTKELDARGDFFLYLSSERFLKEISRKLAEGADLMLAGPMPPDQQARSRKIWEMVSRVTKVSGIGDVSGFGMSSIAIDEGYYRTKWVLHHYAGKGSGFLWNLPGDSARALEMIQYMPKNTVLGMSSSLTLGPLWKVMAEEMATDEEMQKGLLSVRQMMALSGLDLDSVIAGVGPGHTFLVTLNPDRNVVIETAEKPVTVPEPAFAVCIEANDPALLKWLEQMLAVMKAEERPNNGGFKISAMPSGMGPLPFVQPVIARKKGMVIISSQPALLDEMLAVKEGKTPGVASVPEFATTIASMPKTACSFSFASPMLNKVLFDLQANGMKDLAEKEPVLAAGLMKFIQPTESNRWTVSMMQRTEQGWKGEGRSEAYGGQVVVAASVAPVAMMAAIAVPNFQSSRKHAQADAVMEDLRMIDAALEQYAIERSLRDGTAVKFEDLKPFFEPNSRLSLSGNNDLLGNPFNNGKPYLVGKKPVVNQSTVAKLRDVADEGFWAPFVEESK